MGRTMLKSRAAFAQFAVLAATGLTVSCSAASGRVHRGNFAALLWCRDSAAGRAYAFATGAAAGCSGCARPSRECSRSGLLGCDNV
jgi:hypothetical protein